MKISLTDAFLHLFLLKVKIRGWRIKDNSILLKQCHFVTFITLPYYGNTKVQEIPWVSIFTILKDPVNRAYLKPFFKKRDLHLRWWFCISQKNCNYCHSKTWCPAPRMSFWNCSSIWDILWNHCKVCKIVKI